MKRLFSLTAWSILLVMLTACGPLSIFKLQDGVAQTTPFHDGVTQTTPLISGEIRTASGAPAAGVKVRAYVSDYRVSSGGGSSLLPEARTDASGRFRLAAPVGLATIEAEASLESKAIRMNVPVAVGARLSLEPMILLPTGSLAGKVKAEGRSEVLGAMVFIPGTQYMAMANAQGHYVLNHVPAGTYEVAAMLATFATAVTSGVEVKPRQMAEVPEITLKLDAPVLESLSQPNGGPGTELLLRGRNFGASKNTTLSVSFGTLQATDWLRVSDTEIRVSVPEKAKSGKIVVRSDGVESNALEFEVIASLQVQPHYAALFVGERQQFRVEAKNAFGEAIPHPFFDWELGAAYLGQLTPDGELTSQSEGWSEIRAVSGGVKGLGAVGVTSFALDSTESFASGMAGGPGQVVPRPEGLYFTHAATDRIYFQPTGSEPQVLVGTGERGLSPEGVAPLDAKLSLPDGLVFDAEGNLFFSERGNHVVRILPRVDMPWAGRNLKAGRLYTVAGTGEPGFGGEGGPALEALLRAPSALALGDDGALLIADSLNRRVRELSRDGKLRTILGGGTRLAGSGGVAARDYGGDLAYWMDRDAAGNLAFSDHRQLFFYCRKPGLYFGRMMSADMVYPVAGTTETGFNGDGWGTSVRLWSPAGIALDAKGNLYVSDSGNGAVRIMKADGHVRWLAGLKLPEGYSHAPSPMKGHAATSMRLEPRCLALRSDGSLVVGNDLWLRFHVLSPVAQVGYSQ